MTVREPFIFETARGAATTDNVTGTPIGMVVENALSGEDVEDAFKYMKIVGDPAASAGSLSSGSSDTVSFSVYNLPVGATVAWAQVTGEGATNNALTLPSDKTTNPIEATAAANTSAGNLAYVDVTVTYKGVEGTTANGGKLRSEAYTIVT